ncbi:MAG TPA: signal peptide peptidase SppA [Blastocatellia bacterium]|jgi:protease-4|nr:signal peptide peptidase SppA [Blastocatellia bacterium]
MKRFNITTVFIIAAFGFVFFVAIILLAALALTRDGGWTGLGGDRIAVVYIEGVIFDSKTVNEQLKMYGDDSRVKAVLLRIDSPGGGVAASQEISDQVKWLREEKKKKVVVSMGSVAASGGYYIACAADRILANPGTITGSIGVIAEWVNYGNLLKWAQMQPEVIKSGEFKDVGSPTREVTPKERAYLQGLINQMFAQFVNAVAEGRKDAQLSRERITELADGRVYTGEEALREKLIDELGNYEAALKATAKLVDIKGEPQVVTPPKPRRGSILDLLTKTDVGEIISGNRLQAPGAALQFEYLWK